MIVNQLHLSDHADKGNLLLDVPKDFIGIPDWLKNKCIGAGYKEKDEYHVTVIGRDLAKTIDDLGAYDEVDSLINSWSWSIELTDTYIEVAKDDEEGIHRQSIIQLIHVPELDGFFEKLEIIVKQPIPRPPEHITLFTKNYDRGIGIYSPEDLRRYTVRTISN